MKVLGVLVGTAARTGGTAAFVGESARELERLGHEMTVLSTDLAFASSGWLQRQRRVTPAERHPALVTPNVTVLPARFPRRLAFSPSLARAAHDLAPQCDVVHLHNLWQHPQYAGYRAARGAEVPYVVSPHGALDPFLRRHGRARKRISMIIYQQALLRRAAIIHVTTATEAESIADVVPEVPRVVVPCGTYVSDFAVLPGPEQFRRTHLDGYDGLIVLFLGRLSYKKGLDVLVGAFARVRRACECRLVIAGPDDEGLTSGLASAARALGVGGDVRFVGPVYGEDRLAALAAADVWALSSHAENFGIAVVEALAAGCPVAISNAVNVASDIAAAEVGMVAEPTPAHFAEALLELLESDSLRARLSASGREFAARYDWSAVAPQLVEMYHRVAAA